MTELTRKITVDRVIIATAILVGVIAGTAQLTDNSFLLHLRTGVLILDTHQVPRSDPYSFTAHGHPWIVQSWLPEVVYAGLWKLGGGHLVQVFHVVLYAAVGGLLAWLARTGDGFKTAVVTVAAIGFGLWQWVTRPTMFGLLFFILMLVVVQKRMKPYWLIPLGLLWVNSHGSWVLGLVWLVLMMVGARLDGEGHRAPADSGRDTDFYLHYALGLIGGVVAGAVISPAGWRIITFPAVVAGDRAQVFRHISEWKSPNFSSAGFLSGTLILIALIITIGVLSRRRQGWPAVLTVIAFMGAGLISVRNMPLLGAVVAPVLAFALIESSEDDGEPAKPPVSPSAGIAGAAALILFIAVGAVVVGTMLSRPAFNFDAYPVAALEWLDHQGLTGTAHRVAAPDTAGDYRIFKDGTRANVFIDDRYDMYPANVGLDSINLAQVNPDIANVLARYNFDAVLYQKDSPAAVYLRGNPGWKVVYTDDQWQVFEPVPLT